MEVRGETFRIRLTNDMKIQLFNLSKKTNRTVSDIIREAVNEYLKKQ